MIITKYNWLITLAFIAFLGLMVTTTMNTEGANVTWTTETVGGGDPQDTPELYYLFNRTTRTYSDILHWSVDKNAGIITVSMCVEGGTATYKFVDKEWASMFLDETKYLTSALNVTLKNGTKKAKFSPDKWTFEDLGESLLIWREAKTKDESLNESWEFSFKLGNTPKVTFTVFDLDDKNNETRSLQWRIAFEDLSLKVKAKVKDNVTETKVKVKDKVLIDWSDFGIANVSMEVNETTNEVIVYFYDQGVSTNLTIDPTVGFTTTILPDVAYVVLGFANTNNPVAATEVIEYEWFEWYWYDGAVPGTLYAVDHNPVRVTSAINCYFRMYDIYGNAWTAPSFGSGAPGTVTYLNGNLPLCYISVQCSNGIRHDNFHRWGIKCDAGTYLFIDEPVKFPVIVDDTNPHTYTIAVPADDWISDAGTQTVNHGDIVGRRELTLTFDVTLKSEPVTVYVRYYDATTGEGIPWETYVAKWDGSVMGTNVIQTMSNESHTLIVEDYFGNTLYTDTVTANNWDLPIHLWAADITVYSVKLFNQDPNYIHKLALQYNKAGTPYEFYIAPVEVVELFLKAADYRIAWTPYHWYVAQDTQYFDLTIDEANYFLINGTLIANITTTQKGIYALTEIITTLMAPDLVIVYNNLPHPPAWEDLGITYLHPYTIVTAEISYNYTGTSALLWTPHPDRPGRNYTIDRDRLYFSGIYNTRVYINWTSNSTTRFNLTSLPASLDLGDGGNYTIWTNNSIDVTREVTFREYNLFYWSYYMSENKYEYSAPINNTMNLTMRRVNVLIGWPEHRSIDLTGVRVYDINNALLLTRGEHFDATIGGVYLYFDDLLSGTIRTFTVTAWDYNTTGLWDTPVIMMAGEDRKSHGGENYYHVTGSWTNSYSVAYTGSLYISIKINGVIDPSSVIVFDAGASATLSEDSYSVLGNTIIIHGVGPVPIGSNLNYEVFYYKGTDEDGLSIFTPLVGPLSLYWSGLILSLVVGWFGSFRVKGRENRQLYFISIITLVLLFVILGMLHYSGVV